MYHIPVITLYILDAAEFLTAAQIDKTFQFMTKWNAVIGSRIDLTAT